jgi:hypothetical protein
MFSNSHHKSSIQTVYEKGFNDGKIKGLQEAVLLLDDYRFVGDEDIDGAVLHILRDKLKDLYGKE